MRPNTLRLLLSSTSLAALALGADAILVGHIAQAQTTINGASTSVKTSVTGDLTINSGGFLQDATKTLILIDASKNVTNSGIALASGAGGQAINVNTTIQTTITNNINGHFTSDATTTISTVTIADAAKATIKNTGQIANGSSAVGANHAIEFVGGNTGDLINNANGTITSVNGSALVLNSANAAAKTFAGKIQNSGLIQADAVDGIVINRSVISGGLANDQGGTIKITAAAVNAVTVSGAGNVFGITNSGTIQATNGTGNGIQLAGSAGLTGDIANTATGKITVVDGNGIETIALAKLTGNITNAAGGVIESTGNGRAVHVVGEVTGQVSNSGTIRSTGTGNSAVFVQGAIDGGIVNHNGGLIQATGTVTSAILIQGGTADITNQSGGTITSSSTNASGDTIRFNGGTSTVSNDGTISMTGSGVAAINVNSASTVSITNVGPASGVIDGGAGSAIKIGANTTGGITNQQGAVIKNSSASKATILVDAAISLSGAIDNSGTIQNTGGGKAIELLGTVGGKLINRATGTINGPVEIGQNTFDIQGGQVNGNTTGENASTVNFTLTPVSIASFGSFNPFLDSTGFATGGAFALTQGATSSINVTQGAVGIDHDLTAQSINIASGTALVWNAAQGGTGHAIAGNLTNNGMLAILGGTSGSFTGTVTGNLVSSGAILGVGLVHGNGTTNVPNIDIAGAGTFNGNAVLRVYNDYNGYTAAGAHNIVKSSGAMTVAGVTDTNGTILGVDTASNTAVLAYTAQTTANGGTGTGRTITMTIARNGYDDIGAKIGANQRNLGAALEAVGADPTHNGALDPLFGYLDQQTSEAPIQNALQRMQPIVNGAALYGSALGINSLLQSVDSRLANFGGQYVDATPGFAGRGYGTTGLSGASSGRLNGAWLRFSGGTGSQGDIHNSSGFVDGFGFTSWSVALGADREVRDDFRIGVSLAYGSTKVNGRDVDNSELQIRSYQAATYAAWRGGPWFATGVFGFGANSYDGSRTVDFGGFFGVPKADYGGWHLTAKAVAGIELYPSWTGGPGTEIQITPYGSLRYSHLHINGFTETDGGIFNLKVDSQGYDQFVPGFGVRFAKPFKAGGLTLLPWVRPELGFDIIGDRQKTNAAFALAPDTGFTTEGIKPAQTVFSMGFGVNFFNLGPMTASLTGEYQTGLGQSFHSVSGFGQIRFQF